MILSNLHIIGQEKIKHIRIADTHISTVTHHRESLKDAPGEMVIEFEHAVAFPGLINSHDHLDFNLFPLLGNRIYQNYTEWGNDIHAKNKVEINAVLQIPKHLRTQWGVYKNLLNGITTVVNHGEQLAINDRAVSVFQDCYSLHSTRFEKKWKLRLNKPFNSKYPFVMHVGEGTDKLAQQEIDEVIRWNIFKRKMIGVHGVAMNERQAGFFEALVWCPASNYFLLNKTAQVDRMKQITPVVFGTDSTLTADWNIWEQLRLARKQNMLSDEELYQSLTSAPASLWKLNSGAIEKTRSADIVIARNRNNNMDGFYAINPEDILLVLHKGNIRLFDEKLYSQLKNFGIENFGTININGKCKYVESAVPALIKEIKNYYPDVIFPIEINE